MKKNITKLSILAGIVFVAGAGTSAQAQCSSSYGNSCSTSTQYYTTPTQSSYTTYNNVPVYTNQGSCAETSSYATGYRSPAVQYVRQTPVTQHVHARPQAVYFDPTPTRVVVTNRSRYCR